MNKTDKGIITTGYDIHFSPDYRTFVTQMTPTKLRFLLLYWDKIEFVFYNEVQVANRDEIKYLLKTNDVTALVHNYDPNSTYPTVPPLNVFSLESYHKSVIRRAAELEDLNPGQWTLQTNKSGLIMPRKNPKEESPDTTEVHTAEISLVNCLPVPFGDVPICEILNFKSKRSEQFSEFRISLDELYKEIWVSNEIPRSKTAQIRKLEAALKAYNDVAIEKFGRKITVGNWDVSIQMNPETIRNAGAMGVATGLSTGASTSPSMGLYVGLATAALTSTSSIKFRHKSTRMPPPSATHGLDLSYLLELKEADIVRTLER